MESDIELLKAVRAMDKEALVKLFDLYAPPLYHYALRLGCDAVAADHIVGDVFAKFLEQIALGECPKTNLRLYLYQMTHHMIVEKVRYSPQTSPLQEVISFRGDVHSASPALEDRARLDGLLKVTQDDLTADQRHVIVLRFLEGFSLKEIAMILGKEVGHIKVIQNRAIAKLRQLLGYSRTNTTT